ncbi:MAG: hypothetical protein R3B83_01595 [Nitrospirales bacterium]|nr:hypothetical protein [Nitrospirales bacterium]
MATLDLSFNESGEILRRPPHIKANGGVFLIDDFGQQLVQPTDLLNRWIVPLEKQVDYLTLHTGKSLSNPLRYNCVVCHQSGACEVGRQKPFCDGSEIKSILPIRLQAVSHKILRRSAEKGVPMTMTPWIILEFVYQKYQLNMRSCRPLDLIEQIMVSPKFNGVPPTLSKTFIDRARTIPTSLSKLRSMIKVWEDKNLLIEETTSCKGVGLLSGAVPPGAFAPNRAKTGGISFRSRCITLFLHLPLVVGEILNTILQANARTRCRIVQPYFNHLPGPTRACGAGVRFYP